MPDLRYFRRKKKTLKRPLIFVSKGIVRGKRARKSSRERTRNEGVDFPSTYVFARSNTYMCNSCKQLFRVT